MFFFNNSIFEEILHLPMLLSRKFILTLFLLLPFCSYGQLKKYDLYGSAIAKTGEAYPYHVVFSVNGSTLSGYTVTTQPTGAEFKAVITGHINKVKHTLTITEIKSLDNQPQNEVMCLFDSKLTYKLIDGKFVVTGTFVGKDAADNICGEGTMEFEQLNAPGSVFYREKKVLPTPEKPKTDTPVAKEPIVPPNTITDGVEKQIDWVTDTCVLEVWDGGIIDGDVITVLYNDVPVLSNFTLAKAHKQLRIPLAKKKSTITIIAEDEGINPPNTADVLLIDGGKYYKITAYNKQGKRSMIVISKH